MTSISEENLLCKAAQEKCLTSCMHFGGIIGLMCP